MVRFGSWMPANLRIKVFSIIVLQLQRQLCQEEGGKRVSTSTISIFRELDKMYCGVKKCLRSSCSHLEQTFSNNAYNAQLFTFSMAYYRQFSSQQIVSSTVLPCIFGTIYSCKWKFFQTPFETHR